MKGQKKEILTQFAVKCIVVFVLFVTFLSCSVDGEEVYIEQEESHSVDYEVWINGVKSDVYIARTQDPPFSKEKVKLDFGGNYSFTSFDIDGIAKVKIRSAYRSLANTIIRPNETEVMDLTKKSNEVSFEISKPIKLSIEPDGKNTPLLLFANPVIDYSGKKTDADVIYYGPGVHKPENGVVRLIDNQTLYLDEGAIVKAGVVIKGDNVTICGRGILCGNDFVWGQGAREMISIRGNNVLVKDIIVRGSAAWTIPIRNCNNVTIDNVKILGGRAQNDDGINPCNAQDVVIKNCFIRTDDDCIALKGIKQISGSNNNVERITVENSILWCDRARVFLLGHESRAEFMRDILIQNVDIIHFGVMNVFLLEPGENMLLRNVQLEKIQINGDGERQNEFIRLKPTINRYMQTQSPGYIADIRFKDVVLNGNSESYIIELTGADKKHTVKNILFDNSFINNKKIDDRLQFLRIGDDVQNVTFK